MRVVVVMLFLGFSRRANQPKILGLQTSLIFDKKQKQNCVLNFPHFFSGFWSVLFGAL
tara:strand:- start:104 stop:277 length:174 start_codon:yes stop_codon:yes gene_type:complete